MKQVAEQFKSKNTNSFTVLCDCYNLDHSVGCWVEVDGDEYSLSVLHYVEVQTPVFGISRWKAIWNLLTKGYLKYNAEIILDSEAANNWVKVLSKAVKKHG